MPSANPAQGSARMARDATPRSIAVAGMGSAADAAPTWVGATLALATTSVLGVYAGRRLLNKLPLRWIHRVSGVFFLLLALLAVLRSATSKPR